MGLAGGGGGRGGGHHETTAPFGDGGRGAVQRCYPPPPPSASSAIGKAVLKPSSTAATENDRVAQTQWQEKAQAVMLYGRAHPSDHGNTAAWMRPRVADAQGADAATAVVDCPYPPAGRS